MPKPKDQLNVKQLKQVLHNGMPGTWKICFCKLGHNWLAAPLADVLYTYCQTKENAVLKSCQIYGKGHHQDCTCKKDHLATKRQQTWQNIPVTCYIYNNWTFSYIGRVIFYCHLYVKFSHMFEQLLHKLVRKNLKKHLHATRHSTRQKVYWQRMCPYTILTKISCFVSIVIQVSNNSAQQYYKIIALLHITLLTKIQEHSTKITQLVEKEFFLVKLLKRIIPWHMQRKRTSVHRPNFFIE